MLSAFGMRELQAARAVVEIASGQVADLAGLRVFIDTEIRRQADGVASGRRCPSCGRGSLRPVATIEGLKRLGCAACRYSEVVD